MRRALARRQINDTNAGAATPWGTVNPFLLVTEDTGPSKSSTPLQALYSTPVQTS
jgi:hypothetical protein